MKARESCRIGRAPSYAMPTNFLKALPVPSPGWTRRAEMAYTGGRLGRGSDLGRPSPLRGGVTEYRDSNVTDKCHGVPWLRTETGGVRPAERRTMYPARQGRDVCNYLEQTPKEASWRG